MNSILIERIKIILLTSATIILCMQFSSPHSKQGKEKPEINFYGTLVYADGQEVEVENITINNLIRDIVVYHEPPAQPVTKKKHEKGFDLEINRTRLNLDRICRIRTLNPLIIYHNRNYAKIEVLSNDATPIRNIFLIEQRKEILCTLSKSGFEKEVSFSALKEVKLLGQKAQHYEIEKPHDQRYCSFEQQPATIITEEQEVAAVQPTTGHTVVQDPTKDNHLLLTKTNSLIENLEEKAEELPSGSTTETIKKLVQELKDTVVGLF